MSGDGDTVPCTTAFDACLHRQHPQSIWCDATGLRFTNCTITHKASSIKTGDFQCLLEAANWWLPFRNSFTEDKLKLVHRYRRHAHPPWQTHHIGRSVRALGG